MIIYLFYYLILILYICVMMKQIIISMGVYCSKAMKSLKRRRLSPETYWSLANK
jgi:hypothetical protein